ncbi:TonB-dependent receptor [Sphingobium yanoikuyae]|uniref:TonB-dependent receptor n=1 Tax=Sphingobium yanoikuyae TaxID=13690 RepID=UPI003F112A15
MKMRKVAKCASLLVLATTAAFPTIVAAQDTAEPQPAQAADGAVADIVVTGIRQSLSKGIETKRQAVTFVDSIVAEDVGKLPDQNIAESLQRVSGVQIRRSLGDGTSVSIRGLRQNRTEVNGRSLVSPFGRGPGVPADADFNPLSLYPAELISRLEVTKLLSADQIDGSLGGTVNIITRKPLDAPNTMVAGRIEGSYADMLDRKGVSGSLLYSRNFDDRFGVLVNVTASDRPIQEDSFNSFAGFLPLTGAFDPNGDGVADNDPNGDGLAGTYIADLRYQRLRERRKRLGANVVLQWRPTDELELSLDTVYAAGKAKRRRNWFAVALTSNGADYVDYSFSPNEVLVAGTVRRPLQGNDERLTIKDDSLSSALNLRYEKGPWTIKAEGSYSDAQLNYNQTYVRTQTRASYLTSFDFTGGGVPQLTLPSGVDLLDPSLYNYSNFFDNRFESNAKEYAGRVDLRYAIESGVLDSFEVGGRIAKLKTARNSLLSQLTSSVRLTDRDAALYEVGSFPDLLGGKAPFAQSYLVGNPFGTGADFACEAILGSCTPRVLDPTASYKLDEVTKAGYVKLNLKGDLGSIPFSGNIGLRYTRTDRDAVSALRRADGTFQPVTASPSYEDWLPSAVLKFDLTDKLVARVGAAKVVGLPDSQDLSPGLLLNRIVYTGTGGNPNLKPFRADQYDVSLEWYFRQGSALTVGLFYKDIGSFLTTRSTFEDVPGETQQFLVTRKVNGEGGKLKGAEVMLQLPFNFLDGFASGFGILANYSYIDSSTPFVNARTGATLPLEGLSKHNANLVGYYEKDGFGLRVAYNYRSGYLDSVTAGGEGSFFKPYETIDASIRYDFGAFGIYAEAGNLTNEKQIRYTGAPEAIALYAEQGRRFAIGANFKF